MTEFTHAVTTGVLLFKANIIKPKPGNRLRIIEELDPAEAKTQLPNLPVPQLLDKGIPGIRPITS